MDADEQIFKKLEGLLKQVERPYLQDVEVSKAIERAELDLFGHILMQIGYDRDTMGAHLRGYISTDEDRIDKMLQRQKNLAKALLDSNVVPGIETANQMVKTYTQNCATVINNFLGTGRV